MNELEIDCGNGFSFLTSEDGTGQMHYRDPVTGEAKRTALDTDKIAEIHAATDPES